MSTQELITQAQQGDEKAITAIVEKYKGLVITLARTRYLIGGDLEDLIQEGTLGLLKALRQYTPEKGSFSTFAYFGIMSKINDAVRTDNRDKNKALNFALLQTDNTQVSKEADIVQEDNPLTVFLSNEKRERFYSNLRTIINKTQMDILTLYLDGYSYKEISAKLNLTEKKVDNDLQSIKNKIRQSERKFLDESSN